MEVFVKSFSSWRTIKQATLLASDLVLDSLEKETSTLSVRNGSITFSDAGNWLIVSGRVYLISQVKPQEEKTVLTLLSPLDAFSRKIPVADQAEGQTIGGFVASMMREHWIDCPDPVYAIPYLTVSNSDTAPFVLPDADSNGLFDLPAYCRTIRRTHRVNISFQDAGEQLSCTIAQAPVVTRQVVFNDGRSQLKSVDFASTQTAKITAIQAGVTTDWYLSEDGDISQDIPARRAAGAWETISVSADADVAAKVSEAFAKGMSGHKVEFYSELDLPVLADCTLRIYGQPLRSYIACKRKSSADVRFHYKAGELATTAAEKLRGVKK